MTPTIGPGIALLFRQEAILSTFCVHLGGVMVSKLD